MESESQKRGRGRGRGRRGRGKGPARAEANENNAPKLVSTFGGRGRRSRKPQFASPEGEVNAHVEAISTSLEDLEENGEKVRAELEMILQRREAYLVLKGDNNKEAAEEMLRKELLPMARKTANACKRAKKRNRLDEPCEGVSHAQAEDLFLDDTSLGSLSDTEEIYKPPVVERKAEKERKTEKSQSQTQNQAKAAKVDKSLKGDRGKKQRKEEWWHSLTDVDPITVEPLSELRYPPFPLSIAGSDVVHYFDGKMLAHYIVSTGNFSNPNNRQPLSRAECQQLDKYLQENKLPAARVTDAFDLSKTIRVQGDTQGTDESRRAESIRRSATVIMNSLFDFTGSRERDLRSGSSNRGRGGRGRGREQEYQHQSDYTRSVGGFGSTRLVNSVVHEDGNLRIVDGNEWDTIEESTLQDEMEFPSMPSRSSRPNPISYSTAHSIDSLYPPLQGSRRPTPAPASGPSPVDAPRQPFWPRAGEATAREPITVPGPGNFPSLGDQAGTNRASAAMWGQKSLAEVVATAKAPSRETAPVAAQERPKLNLSTPSAQRMQSFITPVADSVGQRTWTSSAKSISELGAGLLCPFLPSTFELARQIGLNFVMQVEKELILFVKSLHTVRSKTLPQMNAAERHFTHLLARDYFGLDTSSIDPEPRRQIVLFKNGHSSIPEFTLSQAMLQFDDLIALQRPGFNDAYRERQVSTASVHSILLLDVSLQSRGRLTATSIENALAGVVRVNSFVVRNLGQTDICLEFSEKVLARKAWSILRSTSPHGLMGVQWKSVQWWPVPDSWAEYQLRLFRLAEKDVKQREREDQRLLSQAHQLQQERAMASSGWDSDDDNSGARAKPSSFTTRPSSRGGKLTAQAMKTSTANVNMYSSLVESDED